MAKAIHRQDWAVGHGFLGNALRKEARGREERVHVKDISHISPCPNLFRRRKQRRRISILISMLMALVAVNIFFWLLPAYALMLQDPQKGPFEKLVAPTGLLENQFGQEDRAQLYQVMGEDIRFVFHRKGREATIRFVCGASPETCAEDPEKSYSLKADQTGRGDLIFKTADGIPVLRVTTTGGATLMGGAGFVPQTIPVSGRAVILAQSE
ncbi:MAG: DUF4908 domain-containing protein [Pseudomonadota bacterium]